MNLFLGVFFEKIGGKWEFIFLNFFSLRKAASFALAHKWRFSEFWASQWHYSIYLLLFFNHCFRFRHLSGLLWPNPDSVTFWADIISVKLFGHHLT